MSFIAKPNTGTLKVNEKRTDENNQPHLRGVINLEPCTHCNPQGAMWLAGWKDKDKEGNFKTCLNRIQYMRRNTTRKRASIPFWNDLKSDHQKVALREEISS